MVYVYVISSKKDNNWYTGSTTDLRKRFSEHNEGKVVSTKGRGPFELIYYEGCIDMNDVFTRERYLKTGMGKRYLKNRLKRFLSLTGQASLEYFILFAIIAGITILSFSTFLPKVWESIQGVKQVQNSNGTSHLEKAADDGYFQKAANAITR
jgi:putative endonuclease